MPIITPDPWTQTYAAIWTALEAHTPLTDLVKLGNRIKYDSTQPPIFKNSLQVTDTPELELRPVGGSVDPFATSQGTQATRDFELRLKAGDLRIDNQLFPVQWEIVRALITHGKVDFGLPFVSHYELATITAEPQNFEEQQGQQGWFAIIVMTVFYRFKRVDITA